MSALFLSGGRAWASETGRQAKRKVAASTEPGWLDLVIDTDRTTGNCHLDSVGFLSDQISSRSASSRLCDS